MDCFLPLPEPALHFCLFTFYFLLLPAIVQPGIVVLAADVGQSPWKGIEVFIDVTGGQYRFADVFQRDVFRIGENDGGKGFEPGILK